MKVFSAKSLLLLASLTVVTDFTMGNSRNGAGGFPDEGLLIGARAVVRGTVVSNISAVDENQDRVFTYTKLRVEQVFKGVIEDREIVLKEEGGEAGALGEFVCGTPGFTVGERVIVYLDTWADGSLRVYQLFLGKRTIKQDPATGRDVAILDLSAGNGVTLTREAREALSAAQPVPVEEYCDALRTAV